MDDSDSIKNSPIHSDEGDRCDKEGGKTKGSENANKKEEVVTDEKSDNTVRQSTSKAGVEEITKKIDRKVRRQRAVRRKVSSSMRRGLLSRKRRMRRDSQDDNTTNSDNSENNALYNEINWEENLEVDTSSLLDEFAPRVPMPAQPSSPEIKQEPNQPESQKLDEYKFSTGCKIHVLDYKSGTWYKATVSEVDWDEEEVLAHYDDSKPDEWVSMNSQRLSETKPKPESNPTSAFEITVTPVTSSNIKSPVKMTEKKVTPHKTEDRKIKKTPRSSLQRKFRRGAWKSDYSFATKHGSLKREQFDVGEKVLAKWSDHRMQKFPAVIKGIHGNGKYDVLFYDGFEKTLMGEDLFKTSEEEIAKYQHSNPSEADSLIDMDIGSKEDRRQRKKKTFDDYLFAKDLYKSRRRSEVESERKPSIVANLSKMGALQTPTRAIKNKRESISSLGLMTNKRRLKRKDRRPSYHREDLGKISDASSEHALENQSFSSLSHEKVNDSLTLSLGDSPEQTLSAETSVSMDESGSESHGVKRIPVNQLPEDGQRWIGDIPPDVYPLKITGIDGILRKSVLVPDKKLPQGWMKHAVTLKSGGSWEPFLVSPDGFKIISKEDLKMYYNDVNKCDPPDTIDFSLYIRALPELAVKQKDWLPKGKVKKWDKRRLKRSRKWSGGEVSVQEPPAQQEVGVSQHGLGRVRTLLPKYRTSSPLVPSQPPSPAQPSTQSESEVWRCPKQGCDKKFRKENLLQMHIKHYHVEFKALVGSAPNVVDLACARSESANSDWSTEQAKSSHPTIKRIMPKTPSHSVSYDRLDLDRQSHTSHTPQTSVSALSSVFSRSEISTHLDEGPLIKLHTPASEEKKSTIKTMLPIRQPIQEPKAVLESEEGESDNEMSQGDGQKMSTGNRLYKLGRNKKQRTEPKFSAVSAPMDDIGMRDHGYPMHPVYNKIIKKKQLSVIDKLQVTTDSNDSFTEEEKASPNTDIMEEHTNIEKLRSEEIINCTCGFKEEDGLMIQCDICLCWQHGLCYGIETEENVPERYVCYICQNPPRVHSSRKYSYAQQYLTQAKLPSLSFRTSKEGELQQRENMLQRCYDISSSLHEIQNVERSMRVKINIAQQADHPKLYLWAKNWNDSPNAKPEVIDNEMKETSEESKDEPGDTTASAPEPEAPIDLEECRVKLLDHIEHYQQQMEQRLTTLQAQVAALESQDPDLASEETADHYPVTKQTVHMLLRDLTTIKKLSAIS